METKCVGWRLHSTEGFSLDRNWWSTTYEIAQFKMYIFIYTSACTTRPYAHTLICVASMFTESMLPTFHSVVLRALLGYSVCSCSAYKNKYLHADLRWQLYFAFDSRQSGLRHVRKQKQSSRKMTDLEHIWRGVTVQEDGSWSMYK